MSERYEHTNKQDDGLDTSERNLHRNFRPVDKPSAELEQLIGLKESIVARGDWIDTGIHDVPVDKINMKDNYVTGPGDFKKVSYDWYAVLEHWKAKSGLWWKKVQASMISRTWIFSVA
jgi:hypothetical protein